MKNLIFDTSPFSYGELHEVIVKLKRRETPGPDDFINEAFKEMNREQAEHLLKLLNEWLHNEYIEQEARIARIVLVLKKRRFSELREL